MTVDEPPADPFALWDAAYVLGSLSSADRRAYEDHLAGCKPCRGAVSELSGVPALLALIDRDEMLGDDDGYPAAPPPPPTLYSDLLRTVQTRRRRSRWLTVAVAATAAAMLVVAALAAVWPGVLSPNPPPITATQALPMTPTEPSEFEASVTLTPRGWGTQIDMSCTYHSWAVDGAEDPEHEDHDGGDKLAMVAVARDGSHAQLATWMALPSSTALPSASTSLPIGEIAAVQIVSADSGTVLLERKL